MASPPSRPVLGVVIAVECRSVLSSAENSFFGLRWFNGDSIGMDEARRDGGGGRDGVRSDVMAD